MKGDLRFKFVDLPPFLSERKYQWRAASAAAETMSLEARKG